MGSLNAGALRGITDLLQLNQSVKDHMAAYPHLFYTPVIVSPEDSLKEVVRKVCPFFRESLKDG